MSLQTRFHLVAFAQSDQSSAGPISDVGQRLLARVERVLGPGDRIVLACQANEVATKGLAQQFGPIDAEPLAESCASAASWSSTRKLNIVIREGYHV